MKRIVTPAILAFILLCFAGCNKDKDTPLVESGGGMQQSGQENEPSLPGASGTTTGTPGTGQSNPGGIGLGTTGGNTGSPLTGGGRGNSMARTENPSITDTGEMIKNEGNNPPPAGRVWCDNCKGHLPKEEAISKEGKNYCPACAAELKIES